MLFLSASLITTPQATLTWVNWPTHRSGQSTRVLSGSAVPGGGTEARRSRVACSAIARGAVGALDLGKLPRRLRSVPRTHPRKQQKSLLVPPLHGLSLERQVDE